MAAETVLAEQFSRVQAGTGTNKNLKKVTKIHPFANQTIDCHVFLRL